MVRWKRKTGTVTSKKKNAVSLCLHHKGSCDGRMYETTYWVLRFSDLKDHSFPNIPANLILGVEQ
jgi:hypothetical protein